MEGFRELIIGLLLGLIAGFILIAASMPDYEEIYESENGYTVEYDGKFYKLVEINPD